MNDIDLDDEDIVFGDNKYGFNFLIGASIEVPLNEKLSFVGNLNYESKSFSRNFKQTTYSFEDFDPLVEGFETTIKFQTRLDYLTVPLNLKYYMGSEKRFFANGGPFLGFLLNSKYEINGADSGNGKDNFKTLDFGFNIGIGTSFKINGKNSLNVEIRHNYGLANIDYNNDTATRISVVEYVKTNSFNLIANWQFN